MQNSLLKENNTWDELLKNIHQSQLQQKYGGEAPDITIFWPPYSPSDEYGVDPEKLVSIHHKNSSSVLENENEESKREFRKSSEIKRGTFKFSNKEVLVSRKSLTSRQSFNRRSKEDIDINLLSKLVNYPKFTRNIFMITGYKFFLLLSVLKFL